MLSPVVGAFTMRLSTSPFVSERRVIGSGRWVHLIVEPATAGLRIEIWARVCRASRCLISKLKATILKRLPQRPARHAKAVNCGKLNTRTRPLPARRSIHLRDNRPSLKPDLTRSNSRQCIPIRWVVSFSSIEKICQTEFSKPSSLQIFFRTSLVLPHQMNYPVWKTVLIRFASLKHPKRPKYMG